MVRYFDRFAGHIERGDPRGPVTVAGGCKWPTIPAFRLLLGSQDATGVYHHFNTEPVLFQLDLELSTHEHGFWYPTILPWWLYEATVEKLYTPNWHPHYRWLVSILLTLVGRVEIATIQRKGRCNVDVRLGNQIGGPLRGRVGSSFRLSQVEHDELLPPSV